MKKLRQCHQTRKVHQAAKVKTNQNQKPYYFLILRIIFRNEAVHLVRVNLAHSCSSKAPFGLNLSLGVVALLLYSQRSEENPESLPNPKPRPLNHFQKPYDVWCTSKTIPVLLTVSVQLVLLVSEVTRRRVRNIIHIGHGQFSKRYAKRRTLALNTCKTRFFLPENLWFRK